MPWTTAWQLIKDVALTGTGIVLIVSQILSKQPSDVLLVTGLALTVPSVAGHAGALLSGHPAPPSSPPSPPPEPPTSPPSSSGATGDRHDNGR